MGGAGGAGVGTKVRTDGGGLGGEAASCWGARRRWSLRTAGGREGSKLPVSLLEDGRLKGGVV